MGEVIDMTNYAYLRLRARRRREVFGSTGDARKSGISATRAFNEGYAKGVKDAIAGFNGGQNA